MRTRRLGDHTVTAIGGGDVCLATSAARGVTRGEVERALHEALAIGITLFDVAPDADSEQLAGAAVRAQSSRDRVVIAARVPMLAERPGAPQRDVLPERLPGAYVQRRVEDSLRASRLEVLPLAQLALRPGWVASPAWPELAGTCARLVREGKVLAWGAQIDDPADDAAPALVAEPWLAALAVVYHVCDRRAEALFAALRTLDTTSSSRASPASPVAGLSSHAPHPSPCASGHPPALATLASSGAQPAGPRDVLLLARQPLAGGALTGNLGPGVHLRERDDRRALDAASLERIAAGIAPLAALVKREPPAVRSTDAARLLAERAERPEHIECHDVAELALRFAIDRAGVALPRLHRREHLASALAAAAAPPLSAALIDRLLAITAPAAP